MDKFKGVSVQFFVDRIHIGIILRVINQDDRTLSEGDVINIEIGEIPFTENLDFNINTASRADFEKKLFEIVFESFSYNLTFFIELDPL